jgi:hypothetical protein
LASTVDSVAGLASVDLVEGMFFEQLPVLIQAVANVAEGVATLDSLRAGRMLATEGVGPADSLIGAMTKSRPAGQL